MNQAEKLLEFEKVVIYCPSALVSAYILVQLYVLANLFDTDYDNNAENQSMFEQWYGFWIFMPTFVFNTGLTIYVGLSTSRRSKALSERDAEINAQRVTNGKKTVNSLDIELEGDDDDDEDADVDDDLVQKQDVSEITAEEETRIMSMNISLISKWLWATPTFFLAACKISWDHDNEYTWKFIITPLTAYIMYYFVIAVKMHNYTWQDQRDIDIAERRQLEMEVISKELAKKRARQRMKKNKDNDNLIYLSAFAICVRWYIIARYSATCGP